MSTHQGLIIRKLDQILERLREFKEDREAKLHGKETESFKKETPEKRADDPWAEFFLRKRRTK